MWWYPDDIIKNIHRGDISEMISIAMNDIIAENAENTYSSFFT